MTKRKFGPNIGPTVDPNRKPPVVNPGNPTTVDPNKPITHVTTPEGAVEVVRAEGEFGDKVALAAFSESNFALFAASKLAVGLFASGADLAAQFEGSVEISGSLTCNGDLRTNGNHFVQGDIQMEGADYAEDFDILNGEGVAPGTVMVLDDAGGVCVSKEPYDRRVAGVISGAGGYKPAVILDRHDDRQATTSDRRPLALMGKVFCMADATHGAIAVGDLLTTSPTPGHAMKATDPLLAFGAVIGKALRPLAVGRGLVPILVSLQ